MITTTELFARVLDAAPGFAAVMDQHLADHPELLSHVLMADCGRFIASYFTGPGSIAGGVPSEDELGQVLRVLETSMIEGDDETQNVIAVSFLEHLWMEPYYSAVRAFLGPALRAEIGRQMDWAAGQPAVEG
jgi:hypothetical protein